MTRSSIDDAPRPPTNPPREDTTRNQDAWRGQNYYGRQQLKPAPFEPAVVGGYIFLAGLSGSSAILGALASARDAGRPRRKRTAAPMVRRSRYLSLLAPTIGSMLLVYDLHTPERFYNMLRVAKKTSPMSIGTWILMSFSAFAGVSGAAQIAADLRPRWRWPNRLAATAQVPAAIAGAGLSTYTAALISATSTPTWAAAPREHAVRFASSSMATAAAALSATEPDPRRRRALDTLLLASLAVEAAAGLMTERRFEATGIGAARESGWSKVEKLGATGAGTLLPIGLLIASRLLERRPGRLARTANLAALAGSAIMRTSILGEGMASARRPDISMRFAQPDNLPRT